MLLNTQIHTTEGETCPNRLSYSKAPSSFRCKNPYRQSFGIAHHAAHRQTGRAECRCRILQRKAYAVIHAHEPGREHPAREILPPATGRTPTAKKADVEKCCGGKNQESGAAPKVPWQKTRQAPEIRHWSP